MSNVNFVQPDVTLTLDLAGIIRRATLSNAISREGIGEWVGRNWADTVVGAGHAQVRQMLDDARTAGVSPFHRIRQRFPSGLELGVEYTTVRLGGDSGLVAVGRNLEAVADLRSRLVAAQVSMERDYWKLREVETRYRLLFDASSQPVLLIGADTMRIVEANPAAIRALGLGSDCLLLPEIPAAQRDVFNAMLTRVREQGKAPGIVVQLGPDRQAWLVRASLVAAEPSAVFVLQLSQSGASQPPAERASQLQLDDLMARLPEAFVVLESEGTIVRANRAFVQLVEHTSELAVLGQHLGTWLRGPGVEGSDLPGVVRRAGAIKELRAMLHGELGAVSEVAISATMSADSNPRAIGVLLRRIQPASGPPAPATVASPRGGSTLRDMIQDTVASVERKCIETALEEAGGNRTAAAQRLGLSRQTLYVKLSRYAAARPEPLSRRAKARKK